MHHLFRLTPLLCVVALLLAALGPTRAAAGQPGPITLESGQGGRLQDAAVEGVLAYLLEGNHLLVLDISDPDAPLVRSRTPMPARAEALAVVGGVVYVVCYVQGEGQCDAHDALWLYDARDPAAPVPLPRPQIGWSGPLGYLRAADGMLWLADGAGLRVFDLRDPLSPTLLATFAGSFFDQAKVGRWLYLVERGLGLQVWDVSDPHAPALRRTLAPVNGLVLDYIGVALSGSRLYLSAFPKNGTDPASVLITFDLSSPASPAVLANVSLPARFVSAAGTRLATLLNGHLLVYDMSDPAHPRTLADQSLGASAFLGQAGRLYARNETAWHILDLDSAGGLTPRGAYRIAWTLAHVWRIWLAGDRLYTQGLHGLQILDVHDPHHPLLQGSLLIEGIDDAPLAIDGDRLVLLHGRTLQVIDATDPYSPTVRATLELPKIDFGMVVSSLAVIGGRAYVLSSGQYTLTRLEIIDISDLASPRLLSVSTLALNNVGSATMHVAGDRVYVASTGIGCARNCPPNRCMVVALDVSDPQHPRQGAGTFSDQNCNISLLATYGTTLFVSGNTTRTFDVSDIEVFKPLAFVYPWRMQAFVAVGRLAYLTDATALTVLDLSDPLRPDTLARYWLGGGGVSLPRIAGQRAYLFSNGLRVLDLRDPLSPTPLAMYEASLSSLWNDGVTDFTVGGDYMYLALAWGGFQVLQLHPERFPTPVWLPLVGKGAA